MEDRQAAPSTSDREARIQARRKRIQERLHALRQGDATGGEDGEQKEEIGKGKQQIIESKRRLLRLKYKTDQDVSSIRVVNDDRENQHRIQEENMRQELRAKLLAEAEQSARQNAAVAMRWADLFSIEVSQDLYEQIEKQRLACEKIITSKDKLVTEIKAELKRKDDDFVKTLKRQSEDVDALLQYMSTQYVEMQNGYREELDEIEAALLAERSDLLEANRRELQDLFDKRSKMEQDFMDRYLSSVEHYQQQLEQLRIADAEDYHILKIRLETDIQSLEQHLEAMRATYQLNTEKLEYNYRVLVERDHENSATIHQQKRKISRQRDILSGLKARFAEMDRKYMDENMRLTDEYKRITEQFKDLQNKFRHFELVDTRKYEEVWDMNEAEVTGLVRQLLQADKIIHEQQLGWSWAPPDEGAFLSPHAPAALLEGSAAKGGEGGEGEEKEEDSEALAAKAVQERIRDPRNLGALQLLIDEGGFLLEARTRGMIEKLPKDDQGMVKLESILRALGVVDGMAFDSLLDALSADSSVEARARGMGTRVPGAVEELSKDQRSSALVTPDDVVRRLKAFVETENTAPRAGISGGAARVAGAMRRADKREKDFWARMVNVISEKDTRVWGRLEKQLESYLGLVSERAASLREVGSLQQQNQELRVLLNTYLSSRINEELVIPPSQVI